MNTESVETLKKEIIKLKNDLQYERERYIKLYNTALEISSDYMKYTEKHPNHDPDDEMDALNLIKKNYDDIVPFDFD